MDVTFEFEPGFQHTHLQFSSFVFPDKNGACQRESSFGFKLDGSHRRGATRLRRTAFRFDLWR